MKKVSCASLRKMLAHGVEFSAEYIGPFCGALSSRRVVAVQTPHHMSSEVLDGPKKGSVVYCDWRGVTVREEEDGGYILTDNNVQPPRDFLRITSIARAAVLALVLLCVSGCASTRQAIVASWEPMPAARVAYMVEIGGDRQ